MVFCEDGGERLLLTGAVRPRVVADENPVKDVLKVSCYCIDRGEYRLEIVDILGNLSIVQSWNHTKKSQDYNFEISVAPYPLGNYIILMTTPKNTMYHSKFTISK
jgi:hypothetical protein